MSTSLPPAFSLGPVSTLQEMLRTIAFVNRSSLSPSHRPV